MIRRTQLKCGKSLRKKTSRQRLIEECDGLTKQLLILERGDICERCGAPDPQAAHVRSKGPDSRLRFMPINLLLLCVQCHLYWWHKQPHEAVEWFEKRYPGRYQELVIWSRIAPKLDLKEIRIALQIELKLKAGNFAAAGFAFCSAAWAGTALYWAVRHV